LTLKTRKSISNAPATQHAERLPITSNRARITPALPSRPTAHPITRRALEPIRPF
jgi:hypothetical protein